MDGHQYENPENYSYETNIDDPIGENVNVVNIQDSTQMGLYRRRMVIGECMRLPHNVNRLPDDIYESWINSFMTNVKDDDNERSKSFRYLWTFDAEGADSTAVPHGAAKSIVQLAKLMKSGKIKRTEIEYSGRGNIDNHPSPTTWQNIMNLKTESWELVKADLVKAENIEGETPQQLTSATPIKEVELKVIDVIVGFITSNYYDCEAKTKYPDDKGSATPGAIAQCYFDDYSSVIKVLRNAHAEGRKFLPIDLVPNFKHGVYRNYREVIAAVKRRYGRCKTQDTMMDFFRELDKAFAEKSPFEFKISNIRNILRKKMITSVDLEDYPECSDFPGDTQIQSYPEEYNPIIATLLQYILFSKHIDKSRWDEIQKEYHTQMRGKPTYRRWHECRNQLWTILDEELRLRKSAVNMIQTEPIDFDEDINNINVDDLDIDEMDDETVIAFVRKRYGRNRSGPNRNQTNRNGNRFQNKNQLPRRNVPIGNRQNGGNKSGPNNIRYPNYNTNPNSGARGQQGRMQRQQLPRRPQQQQRQQPTYRNGINHMSENENGKNQKFENIEARLSKLICFHCSHYNGANMYHLGPKGGGPDSKCPYDAKGQFRPSYRYITHISGMNVNDVDMKDYRATESEGLTFSDENAQNVIYGMDLIDNSYCDRNLNFQLNKVDRSYPQKPPVSIPLRPDRMLKPILKCLFSATERKTGYVLIDTGAASSLVNQHALTKGNYRIVGRRTKPYYGAGGAVLPLADYIVDVKLEVENVGVIEIKQAIVCQGNRSNKVVLMGGPDIRRLGLILDYNEGKITFARGRHSGRSVRMPTIRSLANKDVAFTEVEMRNDRPEVTEPVIRMFENMVCTLDFQSDQSQNKGPGYTNTYSSETYSTSTYSSDTYSSGPDQILLDQLVDGISRVNSEKNIVRMNSEKNNTYRLKNSVEDPEGIQEPHLHKGDDQSLVVNCGDPCIYEGLRDRGVFQCRGCEKCIDKILQKAIESGDIHNPPALDNPSVNPKTALMAYIERIRQTDRDTYTHKDCKIDDDLRNSDPELAKTIENIIDDHKQVFAQDIGCLGPEYTVRGTIKPNTRLSPQRPGHSKVEGDMLAGMIKQFAQLAAHGVIRPCQEVGVVPANMLMVMPVKKKDDEGRVLDVLNSLRIVIDSRPANGQTVFTGSNTDNMNEAIAFALRTSVDGYNGKFDIRNAFFIIPIDPELWKYFCINIPLLGEYCFVRMVQGWAPSPQLCMNTLSQVFFPLKGYYRKFMDDLIIATPKCKATYILKIKQFLKICLNNGIRLKGSKCVFGAKTFNYLGHRIENGTLKPSPHFLLKIKKETIDSLDSRAKLRSWVATIRFLAKFQNRSTDLLKLLNDVSLSKSTEPLVWTKEMKDSYYRIQKAMDELTVLHPFDPELPSVIVVDTSKVATGGFLYQQSDKGPKLITFFSRTRRDKERKIPISSCHMELLGLKSMVSGLMELLCQSRSTITIVTDSRGVVKIFEKYRRGILPSHDTVINNALYTIESLIQANVIHAKNTNTNIKFSDDMSRLGLFVRSETCEGTPKCTICAAADPDADIGNKVINAVQDSISYGNNIGNILLPSKYEGFDLPKDSFIFHTYRIPGDTVTPENLQNYTLRSFLDDARYISELQESDELLRRLRKGLEDGRVSYPKSQQKLQTMLETRQARIENGYITFDKNIDGITYRVVPLPKRGVIPAIGSVHKTIGHTSCTQLYRMVQRHFQFDHMREQVKSFSDRCMKCVLYRGGGTYRRFEQKAVPIPKRFYETILIDEVTRTFRGETIKMVVAMESLSNFMMTIVYKKNMTAALFTQILCQVKAALCPHNRDAVKMTVRCDRASWHTSGAMQTSLKALNIDILFYESKTNSKNIIPELDSRIKIFSQYLVQLVEASSFDAATCCHLATAKTNNTIGHTGHTPAELFCGRGWRNGQQLQIDTNRLIELIRDKRKAKRMYYERKAAEKYGRREQNLIPYNQTELNSPLVTNPDLLKINIGDKVTLKDSFDKNEPRYTYRVTNIKFRAKQLEVVRSSGLDKVAPNPIWVKFDYVDKIFRQNICYFDYPDYDGNNYFDNEFEPYPDIPDEIFRIYLEQCYDAVHRIEQPHIAPEFPFENNFRRYIHHIELQNARGPRAVDIYEN